MKHSQFDFLNILFFSRKQLLHAQQTNLVAQMQWIQANLSGLGPSSSILPPSSFASSQSFMKGHYLFLITYRMLQGINHGIIMINII